VAATPLLLFGAIRLPIEVRLNEEYRAAFFHGAKLNLSLRQQIGQLGFLAALGGFRAWSPTASGSRPTSIGPAPSGAKCSSSSITSPPSSPATSCSGT
jgi:hypothetical protein